MRSVEVLSPSLISIAHLEHFYLFILTCKVVCCRFLLYSYLDAMGRRRCLPARLGAPVSSLSELVCAGFLAGIFWYGLIRDEGSA